MKKYLGYLNNFPREGALKGDPFKGSKELEKELRDRGIISEIEENKKPIFVDSKETISKLEEEAKVKDETISKLEVMLEESVGLAKDKLPTGWEEYKASKET